MERPLYLITEQKDFTKFIDPGFYTYQKERKKVNYIFDCTHFQLLPISQKQNYLIQNQNLAQ